MSFNTALKACAAASSWRRGLRLLALLRSDGLRPDAWSRSATAWRHALQLPSSQAADAAALAALHWRAAAALLSHLDSQGKRNAMGLNTVVAACAAEELWQRALSLRRL